METRREIGMGQGVNGCESALPRQSTISLEPQDGSYIQRLPSQADSGSPGWQSVAAKPGHDSGISVSISGMEQSARHAGSQSMGKENGQHSPKLEAKDLADLIAARVPSAKAIARNPHCVSVKVRGVGYAIHITKRGELKLQCAGQSCRVMDDVDAVVREIETHCEGYTVSHSVTTKALLSMLDAQGGKCALTGRELTPDNTTLDHIVPLSAGGEHSIDNVHLVVGEVNRAKGTMGHEEFIELCRCVVSHCQSRA